MAASLQSIGNGCRAPQVSFPLDFSQAATERTTNDGQSPRISFSLDHLQTTWLSPERREREDVADVSYDTDFEFCVIPKNNNGRQNSVSGETHVPVAEELSVDSEILPLINGPVEAQPVFIARRDVSLESLKCRSPVRSTSSPPSKTTSSCSRNVASKSLRDKPPGTGKEMIFEMSNKKNVFADHNRRNSTSRKTVDQSGNILKQQASPTKSLWSFSRSCRTGGEVKGNCLFRPSLFSRRQPTAECKYNSAISGCLSEEIKNLPRVVEDSKPLEAWSMSNKILSERRLRGQLKPRIEAEEGKAETKPWRNKGGRNKLSGPGLPVVRSGMSDQGSSGRAGGSGRLTVRNVGSSSSSVAKSATLNSPPPGKPMAEGYFLQKDKKSMGRGRVRVTPVVNMSVCMGHAGGRWYGGGGHLSFFSGRDKRQPQPQP